MNASAQWMQSPKRWPLVGQPSNRSESFLKDARMVNCFAELDPVTNEYWVQKRIGFVFNTTLLANGLGRGAYTWHLTGSLAPVPDAWAVVGNGTNASLFKNGVVTGTPLGLTDSPGIWAWTETQPTTGNPQLVFASPGPGAFANLYYVSGIGGWTQAVLPVARGLYIVGLAYLDATIYFMDERCQIFGSNLEDPTTWSALNVITAKKIPGTGVALVKQLNYLLALKSASMEVFYDAANPTGSPLKQIDGATSPFGCASHDTVQVIDGVALYVSSNQTSFPQVIRVDNLAPSVISTPPIERLLAQLLARGGAHYSFVFKHSGHKFYGISSAALNMTLIYDIDQKLWQQWTDPNGDWFKLHSTAVNNLFQHQFLHPTNGSLYTFEGDYIYPTDNGAVAPVDIYTPNTDFGTRRRKTLHRMYIRSDQTPGSLLYVRHSDDDFQHWSIPRKLDLGRTTPYLDNEGTFVKRAYHFRQAAPTAFRIRSADLQMDIGTA